MARTDSGSKAARRWLKVTGGVAASLVLVLGISAPASARDLNGWVWSHNAGQTHLYTTLGDISTYMTKARVQHLHGIDFATTYCGAQARVRGTLTTNVAWSKTFGYESACNFVMVDETTAPNKYFKGGSNFYGKAYHDGAWSDGEPSIRP